MNPIIPCAIAAIVGGLFVAWRTVKKSKASAGATSTAAASSTTAATTATTAAATATTATPPPTPAPAPVAIPRTAPMSTSWFGWVLIIIIAIVFVGRWIWYETGVKSTYSPPQATAPKRDLQQRVITRNLKFVGGDGTIERQGFIEVQKGGHAFYAINDMPWRRDAIFRVVVSLRQKTTGNVVLEINGGRGGQKYYMVPSSSVFGNAVFYDKGEIGRSEYFNPDGGNQILLSSQGGNMEIQYVSIVMIYWE